MHSLKCRKPNVTFAFFVVSLLAQRCATALEFEGDSTSTLLTQIAKHVVHEIESTIAVSDGELSRASQRIDNGASRDKSALQLAELRKLLSKMEENNDGAGLKLTAIEPPVVINVTDDLDITMLVIFAVSGKRIHSGLMTMRVSQPSASNDSKVRCGVEIGHIALSTSHVVGK